MYDDDDAAGRDDGGAAAAREDEARSVDDDFAVDCLQCFESLSIRSRMPELDITSGIRPLRGSESGISICSLTKTSMAVNNKKY